MLSYATYSFIYSMHLFTTYPVRLVALASLVVLGACSKKNDTPTPTPVATTNSISWTVDGKDYTGTAAQTITDGKLLLTGGLSGPNIGDTYGIILNVPAATGTYDLASSNGTTVYMATYQTYLSKVAAAYTASNFSGAGSGTVTITSLTTTEVVGTFSFTGNSNFLPINTTHGTNKTITNGKFSVKR
jgi:hypothetical protein